MSTTNCFVVVFLLTHTINQNILRKHFKYLHSKDDQTFIGHKLLNMAGMISAMLAAHCLPTLLSYLHQAFDLLLCWHLFFIQPMLGEIGLAPFVALRRC